MSFALNLPAQPARDVALNPIAALVKLFGKGLQAVTRRTETVEEQRLRMVLQPLVEQIGSTIAQAEDVADLADLLAEEAAGPRVLTAQWAILHALGGQFLEAVNDEGFEPDGALVDLFGDRYSAEADALGELVVGLFTIFRRLAEAEALDLPWFDPFTTGASLACPADLAHALLAGMRSEAALLALLHGFDVEYAPWLRMALVEACVADRRLQLALMCSIRPDLTDDIRASFDLDLLPLDQWLAELETFDAAIADQIAAADAGRPRPFAADDDG